MKKDGLIIICPECGSTHIDMGKDENGVECYRCDDCELVFDI